MQMELCPNLTVNICNAVKERLGADLEADILCAACELSEDRQTDNRFCFH
jgi:hypothetical protein